MEPKTTLLKNAVEKGDLKTVRTLLQKNRDLIKEPLLLHIILSLHSYEVIDLCHAIITAGCICGAKNEKGETPLHLAARTNNLILVEMIVENSMRKENKNISENASININAFDNEGKTPLHVAAATTCAEPSVVKYLIQNGASIVSIDNNGMTPYDYAEKLKHFAKAQLLNIEEEPETDETHTYDAFNFEVPYPDQSPRKERHSDNVKWSVIVGQWKNATTKEQKWVKKHLSVLNPNVRARMWECFTHATSTKAVHEEYLKSFSEGSKRISPEILKEIRMNLNVFNDHRVFIEGRGKYKLERLVVSYLYDETIGDESIEVSDEERNKKIESVVTPSLCKIGGLLLCVVGEDVAFSLLRQLRSDKYSIGNFLDIEMPEALFIFPRLFKIEIAILYDKLSSIGFELNYFITWFADLFIDVFPVRLVIRIWDYYLYEGKDVLYIIAINYLKYLKSDLMKATSADEAYALIETVSNKLSDSFITSLLKEKIEKSTLQTIRSNFKNHCYFKAQNQKIITI
ncbi:TBC domain containing protein [Entamoeba histolytica HM-1:IMSS-B]|uniref:Rab-GAP TBC domain-containing protein n=5 Tax=Entamoeba histolytica TaxID=5759 RepID=C4M9K3_ENTH1|nr:hypothetical protein EHI_189120 [Entamoeba histolytica HM-1:IMSS]EMH74249.1 TBC domain containing protein [Entamoeba histolytica HM-1:IMSS-B]EMS15909.1 ankyrin repeat-containing protein [Entamoeba histolytica HM-3:IMSS]ENY65051.1 ankyrin repeat-containing protein [Entamoeba histolytica HM-1:IMSS-A]GAT98354.1 hypothetical protein CL6EHI_189120 [Entamoeba histolytica]EAL43930.1 hypothetical protein EHI_189120 [Entamoeba histolytica HM-1:IMSS]|eukprot:XP_649310.1 hypothetical protein EHI_189120 [Entamoeba histolytica HM-1:IMSS]